MHELEFFAPPRTPLTETERIIEEHLVRWNLAHPYCPASMLARELASALGGVETGRSAHGMEAK